MPTRAASFYWGKRDKTNAPGMMIGLFPASDADNGLAKDKIIEVEARATKWEGLKAYVSPNRPSRAPDPIANPFASYAKYLSVGLASSVIAASIY